MKKRAFFYGLRGRRNRAVIINADTNVAAINTPDFRLSLTSWSLEIRVRRNTSGPCYVAVFGVSDVLAIIYNYVANTYELFGPLRLTMNTPVTDNAFHLVKFTFESGTVTAFLDGVQTGQQTGHSFPDYVHTVFKMRMDYDFVQVISDGVIIIRGDFNEEQSQDTPNTGTLGRSFNTAGIPREIL